MSTIPKDRQIQILSEALKRVSIDNPHETDLRNTAEALIPLIPNFLEAGSKKINRFLITEALGVPSPFIVHLRIPNPGINTEKSVAEIFLDLCPNGVSIQTSDYSESNSPLSSGDFLLTGQSDPVESFEDWGLVPSENREFAKFCELLNNKAIKLQEEDQRCMIVGKKNYILVREGIAVSMHPVSTTYPMHVAQEGKGVLHLVNIKRR